MPPGLLGALQFSDLFFELADLDDEVGESSEGGLFAEGLAVGEGGHADAGLGHGEELCGALEMVGARMSNG